MDNQTISLFRRDISAPEWNELSLVKLLNCYTFMGLPAMMGNDVEVTWKKLNHACIIGDITKKELTGWRNDCLLAYGDEEGEETYLSELSQVVEALTSKMWIRKDLTEEGQKIKDSDGHDLPEMWAINLKLTKCPYPDVSFEKRAYYAPADDWSNMTFYEFGMAWEYLNAYLNSGKDEDLHSLLGVIYRPIKEWSQELEDSAFHGDVRQPLRRHEKTIEKRANLWIKTPGQVKDLLSFWAVSCRQSIYNEYADIWSGGGSNGTEDVESGFPQMIMELAGNIVDIDRVADQNVHNVLMYVRKQKKDAERRQPK